MQPQHTGKTALITGAASGIGRELALLFAKDGYDLILVDINADGLNELSQSAYNRYGAKTTVLVKDLADPNAPEEIYAETNSKGQIINVLVNDAGFGEYGRFATETDLKRELAMVQVNATSLMHLTKLFVKDMVARREGKILMLGSEVSVSPIPMTAVYGATKAFIKSFSESIRNELNDTNVTVTVLMPGATNTNFFRTAGADHTKGASDLSKLADPADVAKEGYDALMAGKDHVVAGWTNKFRVALAHILPDPFLAAQGRKDMRPVDHEAEKKQQAITTAVAVGALVLGGLWLLSRNRNVIMPGAYNKARYKYKSGKAIHMAKHEAGSLADSVKGAYKQARSAVEEAVA